MGETLIALASYALASCWTPGPNNAMLAASGATFGWRATQGHAWGVSLGFPLMVFLVALGLGEVFHRLPQLQIAMAWGGAALMLWLAWRIATAGAADGPGGAARPMRFVEAAAFQWINPKAWVMAIGTASTYASGADPLAEAALAAGVFALAGVSSSQGWALFGTVIGQSLGRGWRLRAFNATMGALVAVSALWLVLDA